MVYNYEDVSEIPDLMDFKERLIEDLLLSVFYQQPFENEYNMLKLPVIISPCILRKQVNNEAMKQSIMERKFSYNEENLGTFIELLDKKELDITRISELPGRELTRLAKKIGIYNEKKTGEIIKIDLHNLSKIFLGGQVST